MTPDRNPNEPEPPLMVSHLNPETHITITISKRRLRQFMLLVFLVTFGAATSIFNVKKSLEAHLVSVSDSFHHSPPATPVTVVITNDHQAKTRRVSAYTSSSGRGRAAFTLPEHLKYSARNKEPFVRNNSTSAARTKRKTIPKIQKAYNDNRVHIAKTSTRKNTGLVTTEDHQDNNNNNNNNTRASSSVTKTVHFSLPTDLLPPKIEYSVVSAVKFYKYHARQIRSLIDQSSIMDWTTRDSVEYKALLRRFDVSDFKIANRYSNQDEDDNDNDKDEVDNKHYDTIFALPASGSFIRHEGGICHTAKAFHTYWKRNNNNNNNNNNSNSNTKESPSNTSTKSLHRPHVLFEDLNENWGALSSEIANKTFMWGDLIENWRLQGCSENDILAYLDHPDTKAVITTQFQIFDHPKVHSLPLGVQSFHAGELLVAIKNLGGMKGGLKDKETKDKPVIRKKLLMVNNSPIENREATFKVVNPKFKGTLHNSYKDGDTQQFYEEMLNSLFILSPYGVGADCYRHWEAIYMGVIPVIETLNRTDGWFRSFNDLPVAFIDFFENLTPDFLQKAYQRIIQDPRQYKYEKMTKQYWIKFIHSFLE